MGPQHEHGVALRFEKVAAFFLDGIPRPFLYVSSNVEHGVTFDFSCFGFSPDYSGQTEPVCFPEFQESCSFTPVCLWRCTSSFSSPSARIGSHYSPYVGTFRFDGKGPIVQHIPPNSKAHTVRVPIEGCEGPRCTSSSCDRDIRTSLFVDLYEKVAERFLTHERESLRRIVLLGSKGTPAKYRDVVEQVVSEIRKLFVRACSEAIYGYMSHNILFRRIVAPLSLTVLPGDQMASQMGVTDSNTRLERHLTFSSSLSSLESSMRWGEGTHRFFTNLQECWTNRFDRLVIFDTTTTSWRTSADTFLAQIGSSMRAAFALIRIEFYTRVEHLLLGGIRESKLLLSSDSKAMKDSNLSRIFMATRVFLVSHIRSLIHEALKDLVHFFTAAGESVVPPAKARKMPLLEVHLTVGDCSLPRSHSFAQLRFGIADLLDELLISANSLPVPEVVIMRTLDFERCALNSFDSAEVSTKAVLLRSLDAAGAMVEELAEKYAAFSDPPSVSGAYFTRTSEAIVQAHISLLREGIEKISKVSPDIVFFGCIAINCTEVKRCYTEKWSRYMENYLSAISSDILSYLVSTIEKCRCHNERLSREPKTVEELEELGRAIKDAESLSGEIETNNCKQVIEWFHCLEILRIPVEAQLYASAMELMRTPSELMHVVSKGLEICTQSKPRILANLNELRSDARGHVKIIRDGVNELLGLFNLDVCDIAAQTCEELRVVVDQVVEAIDHIFSCDRSLEIEHVDCFEDFFPLLGTFEVLEQFWGAIFDSTVIRDYYNVPVNSLSALKVIEDVQQCRRLIHSSTRNLRAYPGLVRLGRQQEQVLADFESLEGILVCITTPALRKNHWKEIARILGLQSNNNSTIDSNVTLKPLLEAGIHNHLDELKRVVDPAVVDFETEASLERMKSEAKKIPFLFCLIEGTKDVFALSPVCRDSINSQLESFLQDLRVLRQQASLSQFVLNSISEWEAAAEKMRGTLLYWKEIEQEWVEVLRFGVTLESLEEGETPAAGSREWKFLQGKIGSVTDIFSILFTTLQKPQYTLFTAMMQENIQEQLSLACTILGDIRKVITSLLDARREAFPRFWFLSDAEMISFLSVFNVSTLTRLLSKMYSRVCDVGLEGNTIVAFKTADGATLKSETPIFSSSVPVERWMKTFDKTLRSSLLRELQACVNNHYHMDSMAWVCDSCVQLIDVALRVIHNRDFRAALSIAGGAGIHAYSTRLGDLTEEYMRLAAGYIEREERRIVSSVITILLYCRREVYLALKSGVQTIDDLDRTPMLQTFMEGGEIVVQTLGFRLPYGMEFLGNYDIPVLFPEYVEKGLCSILVSFAASSFPIVVGNPERESSLEYSAHYLGRFLFRLQCHPALTFEGVVRGLRGALSVGAVFCLNDIDLLEMNLIQPITQLLQSVEAACQSEKEPLNYDTVKIDFEVGETKLCVPKNSCFQAVLAMPKFSNIPTSLSLAFRPIYMPSLDLRVIALGTLQALGYSQSMMVGQKLAAMYAQLMEVSPNIFSIKKFVYVIQDAATRNAGTLAENLCTSFLRQFWQVTQFSDRLHKLLGWNMVHTLGIPEELWEDAVEEIKSMSEFDGVLERFTQFMECNLSVALVGPVYSGKTKLWKRWIGNAHHSVISFRLMSCMEIYGDACEAGVLASLAKQWDSLTNHTIILEDADLSQVSIVFETPLYARIRPYSGPDFMKGPLTRVIVVKPVLDKVNPRVMSDFAVFNLPRETNWKSFLKELLQTAPCYHAGLAFSIMVALIDAILDSFIPLGRLTVSCENRFAVASGCSQLYKRWYDYAQSRCGCRDEWVSEQAFAMQCAVFATCWFLGSRLYMEHHIVLRTALEKVQAKLRKIARETGLTEDVLPPCDSDILSYIATPAGWKRLGRETEEVGFTTAWVLKWKGMDVQRPAWSQFFPFPSRESTFLALEHLIGAGQPVLLVGGGDQGKSTILRQMRCNERWTHQMVYNNRDCKASEIQEALLQNLSLRHSKVYGPCIGKKLVLCVDDVYLSGDGFFSQAIHLFSFIDRLSAICPPSLGYIPITDVVCVGTSTPTSFFDEKVEGILLRLQLPEINDADVVGGVQELFNLACAARRGINMSKEVAAFLSDIQSVALYLMPEELKRKHVDGGAFLGIGEDNSMKDVAQEFCCRSILGFASQGGFSLSYMHMFLRISDRVLRLLRSPLTDAEVMKNIYDSVYTFYMVMFSNTEKGEVRLLQTQLKKSAEVTLKGCLEAASVSFDDVYDDRVEEACDDTELPPCDSAVVQQWMRSYDMGLGPNAIEESLSANGSASVIVAPPHLPKVRPASASSQGTADREMKPPPVSVVQYASRWMASLISSLHQCLRQEQVHVALIGPYDNGIHRALRIWGAAVRIHVAFLRDNYTGADAKEYFKKDLTEILQRTCRNDGRMVLFVPNSVMGLGWPMRRLDVIFRDGDVSQLFTFDEQLFLLHGRRGIRRTSGRLTPAEQTELRQRVCRRLSLVTHSLNYAEMNRLGGEIPFLTFMSPLPLCAAEMLRELVDSLFYLEKTNHCLTLLLPVESSDNTRERVFQHPPELVGRPFGQLLCDIFDVVKVEVNIQLEQLLEFGFQVQQLRHFLGKLRRQSAQSRRITELPDTINRKMLEYDEAIKKATEAKRVSERQLQSLLARLQYREKRLSEYQAIINNLMQEANSAEALITREEADVQAKAGSVTAVLSMAASRLSSMKSTHIKQFITLPPPAKGKLLVKVVCKVIGEELHPGSAKEIWEQGKALMASPNFFPRLLAVSPGTLEYESLAPLHGSLREVRYGDISPFAGAVSEYVLAILEAARVREEVREVDLRLNETRLNYSYTRIKLDGVMNRMNTTMKKINDARTDVKLLEMRCEHLKLVIDDAEKRRNAILLLTDIVDRFSLFHSLEENGAKEVQAEKGEGAILMFSAHHAFFAMLPLDQQRKCFSQLHTLLNAWGIEAPSRLDNPIFSLLFPSITDISDSALVETLSFHEKLCVGALLQKVHFHWPFFGGVSPVFERVVKQCLKSMSGDCITISALDTKFVKSLLDAVRNGSGLLVCDATVSFVLEMLRPLLLLRQILRDEAAWKRKVNCSLFGENVEVKSSFYLVCVSPAVVTCDEAGHVASRFMTITNFHSSSTLRDRVHATVLLSPTVCDESEVNDIFGARNDEDAKILGGFRDALHQTTALLCDDIDDIAGNKDNRLEQLGTLLGDMKTYHARIVHLSMVQRSVQRQLQVSWVQLTKGVCCVEHALYVIEGKILGRQWNLGRLEALVLSATDLMQPYLRRLSPNAFNALPKPHMEFYALINFVERVVQVFACSWPCELRGLFAWYILSSVVNGCEVVVRLRGELYSTSTVVLNQEQYKVLSLLLNRQDEVVDKQVVLRAYAASSDALLNELAQGDNPGFIGNTNPATPTCDHSVFLDKTTNGPGEGLIRNLFAHWARLEYTTCELIASCLYDAFLFAVKEQNAERGGEVALLYECAHPANVHSKEARTRFCSNAGIPLFLRARDLSYALKDFEQRVKAEKLWYQICHVYDTHDIHELMKKITECFGTFPPSGNRGHCIMVILVPSVDVSNEPRFIQSLSTQLSRYCRYGTWGLQRNRETTRFPVLLCWTVLGSPRLNHSIYIRVLEESCLTLTAETSLSEGFLPDLLQDSSLFRSWRRKGAILLLDSSPTADHSSDKEARGGVYMREGSFLSTTAKLSNVIELHVGLATRQSMPRALFEEEGLGSIFSVLLQTSINSDDLALILRLMAIWMMNYRNEATKRSGKRSLRFLGSLGNTHSFSDLDQPAGQPRRKSYTNYSDDYHLDRINSAFSKVAYSIYTARMNTWGRLAVAEMLRQRSSSHLTEGTQLIGTFVAVEEAIEAGGSGSSFLTELRQSSEELLDLSGDGSSVAAYRKMVSELIQSIIYGRRTLPGIVVGSDKEANTADSARDVSKTSLTPETEDISESTHLSDIIQLVFLWEKNHGESLAVSLEGAGHTMTALRVRAAMARLRCWLPGNTLTVWLPALRYPRLLLYIFAAQAVSRKADDFSRVETVLVLLRRYNLVHDDIVLLGAALSKPLEREVLSHTDWDASQLMWNKGSDVKESEEDLVLAIRFRCSPEKNVEESLGNMLWELRFDERRQEPRETSSPTQFTLWKGVSAKLFPSMWEIQSACSIPVIGAVPPAPSVRARNGDTAGEVEMEDADEDERRGNGWCLLFDLPLCVIVTGGDDVRRRKIFSKRPQPALGRPMPIMQQQQQSGDASVGEVVSVLSDSMSFFVRVS